MAVLIETPEITSVRLRGLDTVSLPFTSAGDVSEDDDYIVKQIDGLDPPEQNVAIAKTASGGKYQGVESQDREIVALIMLNKERAKSLRNNLYTMLRTGVDPKVWVDFMSGDSLFATVEAYCKRFEAALFVKDPAIQITLRALNPTFRSPILTKYAPGDLSELNPNIYNSGTAEAGFQFAVTFTGSMSSWYIKVAEDQNYGMQFTKAFVSGDTLEVSTIPGKRYVHWKKAGGTVQNMMSILTADSEWLTLHPGSNHFVMPPGTNWNWVGDLSFTPQYWGL